MGGIDRHHERRRRMRHVWPKLTITIDNEQVTTSDWSVRGFKLEPSALAMVYIPGEAVAGTISHPELTGGDEHLFVGRVTRCQLTQRVLAVEIAGRDEILERIEQFCQA